MMGGSSGDPTILLNQQEEEEDIALAALVEGARFYVYAYNTSTLVTTAGLALGIFFIVTSIALYAYYYSGADQAKRSDRSWERGGAKDNGLPDTSRVVGVLGLLEEAWAGYGVAEQACKRRVSCEAELWASYGVTVPAVDLLSSLIGQITYDDLANVSVSQATDIWALRQAAERGRVDGDCQAYEQECPSVSITNIRRK